MISEFITYLQGAGLTPEVRFAFTTEPIDDYDADLPVVMVYPKGYTGGANETDNFVIQQTEVDVACLLGCAVGDYEALLDELRAAAVGWVFETNDAMEFGSASIIGIKGGFIWWEEVYTARGQIRQTT